MFPKNYAHRRNLILFATFLLCLPSLWAGYMGDDYIHHALLNAHLPIGKPNDLSLFGLFSFINGDPERNRLLMDYSLIPWWTYSELKYAFWRPLSEISHWMDHRLWPHSPWVMHLHNLLWFIATLAIIAKLYKHTLTGAGAILCALAIYSFDSSHGFTLSWIANRNGLIALFFGMLTLLLHRAWRLGDSPVHLVLSLLTMTCALLSAEIGISTFGYLGAYALFMDKRGPIKGVIATLPYLLAIATWWTVYKTSGFGADHADGYYVDPAEHPVTFLLKLVERLPVLLASQWGLIPAELYGFSGRSNWAYVLGCSLFVIICLIPVLYNSGKNKVNLFWFFGMLFSLMPALTALPHDRLLVFSGVGASALIGSFIHQIFALKIRPESTLFRGYSVFIAGLLVSLHLVISPLLLPLMSYSTKIWADMIPQEPSYFPEIDKIEEKQIVLFSPPFASSLAIGPLRFYRNEPMPKRIWTITSLPDELEYEIKDSHSIEVRSKNGFIQGAEEAVRNLDKYPFHDGEKTALSGLVISLHDLNSEGKPTRLLLTFKTSIGDSSLLLLRWDESTKSYAPLTSLQDSLR